MHWLFVFSLLFCIPLLGKVRVLTCHYNEPSFIALQHRCLKKFLIDDHELIVFNDAKTEENEKGIREVCERLEVRCIRFQPEWHETDALNAQVRKWVQDITVKKLSFLNVPLESISQQPSIRHCHVLQYALDRYGYSHDDAVVILDGDAFFIREVEIKKKLERFEVFGMTRPLKEADTSYFWVPFVVFDPRKLPDVRDLKFHVAVLNHTLHDTGAQSEYYLRDHPKVLYEKTLPQSSHKLRRRSDRELKEKGYSAAECSLIRQLPRIAPAEFNIENGILHFRAVSFYQPGHKEKAECLQKFMDQILSS